MRVKNDLLRSSFNKKFVWIDEGTENIIKVTNEIQKINFVGSGPYKTSKQFDIKQNDLT